MAYFLVATKSTWDALRAKGPLVPWSNIIWFPREVPRWAIIKWMGVQGRLNTRDRLMRWGIATDGICPLCCTDQEKHHHLYFECSHSSNVWKHFLQKNEIYRPSLSLLDEIEWALQHRKGLSFKHSIF